MPKTSAVSTGEANATDPSTEPPSQPNPLKDIFNYIWSIAVGCTACYALLELNFLKVLLTSSKVDHTLFLLSLCSSILILTIKIYLEAIAIPILKQTISYETIPRLTHLALFLILFSSLTFILSITPHYGFFHAFLISCLVGYGLIWQYFLTVPYSNLQNIIAMIGSVYFLQMYTGFVEY